MARKEARKRPVGAGGSEARLPLSALLSRVLVAFTIEVDNAFEQEMPHRTTLPSKATVAREGPWLGSLVLWLNVMQFVPEEGVTVGALQRLARTERLLLAGLERWGYVVLEARTSAGPAPRRREVVVRPTAAGRRAQEVWRPLPGQVEKRWQKRFSKQSIDGLRESLSAIVQKLEGDFPAYLPVVGHGLFAEVFRDEGEKPTGGGTGSPLPALLPVLLSRVLLAFTLDFERHWKLSLAMSANVLRLLSEEGVAVTELPRQSGVSKEAIAVSLGFLVKKGQVALGRHPTEGRTRTARLTSKGRAAQAAFQERLEAVEESWKVRFGADALRTLRAALEALAPPLLFSGMEPHTDGWRAGVPKPEALPHHPMVLHRGGFPDGA
jgi:DNA-binding MarR family transcriptional regulator